MCRGLFRLSRLPLEKEDERAPGVNAPGTVPGVAFELEGVYILSSRLEELRELGGRPWAVPGAVPGRPPSDGEWGAVLGVVPDAVPGISAPCSDAVFSTDSVSSALSFPSFCSVLRAAFSSASLRWMGR